MLALDGGDVLGLGVEGLGGGLGGVLLQGGGRRGVGLDRDVPGEGVDAGDVLVIGLDQDGLAGGVVGACEVDLLGPLRGDRVGGDDGLDRAVGQDGLARLGGDLLDFEEGAGVDSK